MELEESAYQPSRRLTAEKMSAVGQAIKFLEEAQNAYALG